MRTQDESRETDWDDPIDGEDDAAIQDDEDSVPAPVPAEGFREVRDRTSVVAFLLGVGVLGAAIALGRSFAFFIAFPVFSIILTLLWGKKAPRPWIYLASIAAASPVSVSREQFTCNAIFAIWLAMLSPRSLSKLPQWAYLLLIMASFGFVTGSINWISSRPTVIGSIIHEGTYAFNFIAAIFILLPLIYFRMEKSANFEANLQGLLFCLILPSTLILLCAKLHGHVTNAWEASQHGAAEGYLEYQLGRVSINFLRTEVGFILAALACAAAAVAISPVKIIYRAIAGACFAVNAYLLLFTASFGSILGCLAGLAAMSSTLARKAGVARLVTAAAVVVSVLILAFAFFSTKMVHYLDARYTHHVTHENTDRIPLWTRAVEEFIRHPEGIGWTLDVGDVKKTFMHNDYLVYFVSYSLTGGLAYLSLVAGFLFYFLAYPPDMEGGGPSALAVHLAGLGAASVIALNSMTDHMTENRWYFTLIWSIVWYSYFCSRAARAAASPKLAADDDVYAESEAIEDDPGLYFT